MELEVIISASKIVYKYGKKQLDSMNHLQEINEIYRNIVKVYTDISRAHFDSARASLKASAVSSRPEAEIHAAIHHLMDAYHIMTQLLTATKTEKVFLVFTKTVKIVDDTMSVHENCLKACLLIHDLYCVLEEQKNAVQWERRTKSHLDRWVNCFKKEYSIADYWEDNEEKYTINRFAYEKLEAISGDYVWEDSNDTFHGDVGCWEIDRTYYITVEGHKYCLRLIRKTISNTISKLTKSKDMLLNASNEL